VHNNKIALFNSWFAILLSSSERMMTTVPQYFHFNLSKHVMRRQQVLLVHML
jgi:hypothetical protein